MINVNLLPKHLRRVREPGYWRFVAALFPLLVLGTLAFTQYAVNQTVANKQAEIATLEARKAALQEFIERRNALVAQQQQLNDLIAVRNAVQADRIVWTGELNSVLETLPSQGEGLRPRIDFQSLTMQAVTPPSADESRFEGKTVIAEMNVSGNVVNPEVLAEFIRALETSPEFGVAFQTATRNEETGIYTYSLNIGAVGDATDDATDDAALDDAALGETP